MEMFEGYLYHIVRYNKLTKGQNLQFGGKPNYFCKKMNQREFVVEENDINSLVLNKQLKDFSFDEAKVLKSYINESCFMIRELVLENVRLKEFPDMPSRLECLYCTETLEEAKKWVPILLRMNKTNKPLQIVKLMAKGKIFVGDGNLMLRNTYSIDSKIQMARKYWGQETTSENREVLFVGGAQVVEIIDNFVQ